MRITFIARGCRPGSGIELYTHELINRLSSRHEIVLLTNPKEVAGCQSAIIPIQPWTKPHWYSVLAFSTQAGAAAKKLDSDLVHTQGSDGSWGDVVTAHSCHVAGMHASLRLRPTLINYFRKWVSPAHRAVVRQERLAFASARLIIAVSKRVRRQLRAVYSETRTKPVKVIYPGVDVQAYSPTKLANTRAASRRRYGFSSDQIVFVLVANSPVLKGAERILRALAVLENKNTHLLIASGGTHFPKLTRLAGRLGVQDRLHITQARHNALPVYAAGDVYIALPEYESFGLTILEAMACGLPIILTRNAGVAELLRPGVEGFLLPARVRTKVVAQAMDYLSQDEETRQTMGHAARLTAEDHTWEKTVRAVEKQYEALFNTMKIETDRQ